jgi:hypothetical protein
MKDVPDMMARCYCFVHEKIENADSELIVISLEEYKLVLDIGAICLMHQYRRYTPNVFPGTAPGDSIVSKANESADIDMAVPSMDDSGPVFRLQWKPPKQYGRTSTQRDVKYGKKSSVEHKPNNDSNQNTT